MSQIRASLLFKLGFLKKRLTVIFNSFLQEFELTSSQLVILSEMLTEKPHSMTELAKRVGSDRTTINKSCSPLVKMGLIYYERYKREADIGITEKGKALVIKAMKRWDETEAKIEKLIGASLVKELKEALDEAYEAVKK